MHKRTMRLPNKHIYAMCILSLESETTYSYYWILFFLFFNANLFKICLEFS